MAAELALYCGQAVQTDYRTDASGAYLAEAAEAFRQYFGYDRDVQHVVATHYMSREADDAQQWDEVLSTDTLLVIPSGGVPMSVVFPLGDLPDGRYSLDLRCQDFGSYVPYGTTHALTDHSQTFAVGSAAGISQPREPRAATKKAVRWTLGGRRAAGRAGGLIITGGREVLTNP